MSITFQLAAKGDTNPMNLSNANACALLRLAGLPADPAGEVGAGRLDEVLARLLRVANIGTLRAHAACAEEISESGRWQQAGRDDAYVQRRVLEFVALLQAARSRASDVVWG